MFFQKKKKACNLYLWIYVLWQLVNLKNEPLEVVFMNLVFFQRTKKLVHIQIGFYVCLNCSISLYLKIGTTLDNFHLWISRKQHESEQYNWYMSKTHCNNRYSKGNFAKWLKPMLCGSLNFYRTISSCSLIIPRSKSH